MKNNFFKSLAIIFAIFMMNINAYGQEQFNFDITEVEILDGGNIYKGYKRGSITTNNGISINADRFDYNKALNVLNSYGDVLLYDGIKNIAIFTEKATYFKNDELIFTDGDSKANNENGIIITADKFKYDKNLNIFNAYGNVKIDNPEKNYVIYSEEATYFKNEEKIITKGITKAFIQSKYIIDSKNVLYLVDEANFSSKEDSIVNDSESNFYYLDEFKFSINDEELIGDNIYAITNYGLQTEDNDIKSDQLFLSDAIINFKENSFIAKKTKVLIDKSILGDTRNDPRIKGASSKGSNDITTIKKGVFTSCGDEGTCAPWSVKAEEITHDKNKRQLIYKNAFLRVYDVPVLYFPKFFHPDPSVKRQSGFLRPKYSTSTILGSSFYLPYFLALSDNKDLTVRPTYFDKEIYSLQTEYRQKNKNSEFLGDIGITKNYRSKTVNVPKKNFYHFFARYNKDLDIDYFSTSTLAVSVNRASNDLYLKIFDKTLDETPLKQSGNTLANSLNMILDHKDYNFDTGMSMYENLKVSTSDKYQYGSYYNFNKNLFFDNIPGSFNISSKGTSTLKNTNEVKSKVFNNAYYKSKSYISDSGFKNNFNSYFKNYNNAQKKNDYDPTIRFRHIYEYESSFPLSKKDLNWSNTLTPKISYRINPGFMNDQGSLGRRMTIGNVFSINRLGLEEEFENGQSLTYGINYNKKNLQKPDQNFSYSLASVYRNKKNVNIPESSTIGNRHSDIFGSFKNKFSKYLTVNYDFSIDNDLNTLHYNSIMAGISINNFVTQFNFVEENSKYVDTNVITNTTSYNFAENNFINFKTRRNRKINLTEYYDLVYQYKKDCLIAGIKYKRTFYEDRELKPREDLLFTITLIPITTYEHKADSWDF